MNIQDFLYNDDDNRKQRGIDYDLEAAIESNDVSFTLDDIEMVLAVHEGKNDEEDWEWVIQLRGEREMQYIFLNGGCDYTGWDCQSWLAEVYTGTAIEAAKLSNNGAELLEQLQSGKYKTWAENNL